MGSFYCGKEMISMSVKNKYKIERRYIRKGKSRSGKKLTTGKPKFIVAHETANSTTGADGHFNYFNNTQPEASAHTFIDAIKILEIIPLDEKAWHVQYQKPKDNQMFGHESNDAAIGVELCRPGDFAKAYDRYAWYHAYLCRKYGLQPKKHIVSHKVLDPQRRSDPQSWLEPNGVTWNQFINDVQAYYDDWEKEETKTVKPNKPKTASSNTSTSKPQAKLTVDGYWAYELTKSLQRFFGTPVDGELWGQYSGNQATQALTGGVKYGKGGSAVIKALQKYLNSKGYKLVVDGILGKSTVKALQKYLGMKYVDGIISKPSPMVKELQRRLNAGTF